jgi:hypothetical protein
MEIQNSQGTKNITQMKLKLRQLFSVLNVKVIGVN